MFGRLFSIFRGAARSSSEPAALGLLCRCDLPADAAGEAEGFYTWIAVRTDRPDTARSEAIAFLMADGAASIDVEEMRDVDDAELETPDRVQQMGGKAFYGPEGD